MNHLFAKYKHGVLKYIRLANEIRIFHLDVDHDSKVNKGEQVVSAGCIVFDTEPSGVRYFHVPDHKSHTLKLGPLPEDANLIAEQEGIEHRPVEGSIHDQRRKTGELLQENDSAD